MKAVFKRCANSQESLPSSVLSDFTDTQADQIGVVHGRTCDFVGLVVPRIMLFQSNEIDPLTLHATLTILCLASNNWDIGKQGRPRQDATERGV